MHSKDNLAEWFPDKASWCRNEKGVKSTKVLELSDASFDNVTLLQSFGIPSHQQVDEYANNMQGIRRVSIIY